MTEQLMTSVDRRHLLTHVVPACGLACLFSELAGADEKPRKVEKEVQNAHKFEVEFEQTTTMLRQVQGQNRSFVSFIKALQSELDEDELVRLLNIYSAENGRQVGERHAKRSPDTSFQTFTATFRPPRYENSLTHEIVTDTPKVFELKVTECVWAKVFRDAGLGGQLGHAAVCNMDFYWPTAFNPDFKMERTKTLMQGHDCCNHRYIDTA
jgi:hypothetical protein